MDGRFSNNFDFLRFFAAFSIIISHCFALSLGYSHIFLFDWHLLYGQFGLATLLVISGYLITGSWERRPEAGSFFWKRTLRIVPGLILALMMLILIIGPLNTTLPLSEYFGRLTSLSTWLAAPFYTNGAVLGLFESNPVPYVDAPLWTIPFEFLLYIIIAILGVAYVLRKRGIMIPFALVTALLWLSYYDNPAMNKIRFAIYFFAGSFLYINRDKIPLRWWIAVLLFVPVALSYGTVYMFAFAFFAIPYAVIWFAHAKIPHLCRFGRGGDPSYGMYIYTYPIQQTILNFIPGIAIQNFIVLTLCCSVPLAYLSWHLVEKKALGLKKEFFGPKRGPDAVL